MELQNYFYQKKNYGIIKQIVLVYTQRLYNV